MTYVVIAYGLVAGVLTAYGLRLLGERRTLRRRLAKASEGDRA